MLKPLDPLKTVMQALDALYEAFADVPGAELHSVPAELPQPGYAPDFMVHLNFNGDRQEQATADR